MVDDYKKRFEEIKNLGWIKSLRNGDTGIGYTLEKIVKQTNDEKKDLRIKSIRKGSNRKLTLFAKIPIWGQGGRTKLLEDFGYFDKNNRWSLYTSITTRKETSKGWQIELDEDKIFLNNKKKAVIYWQLTSLQAIIKKKLNSSVMVYADHKKEDGQEFFKYEDFYLANDPEIHNFTKLILDGSVCIDLAIHKDKETNKVIDKGFLFRININRLGELFNSIEKIEI